MAAIALYVIIVVLILICIGLTVAFFIIRKDVNDTSTTESVYCPTVICADGKPPVKQKEEEE